MPTAPLRYCLTPGCSNRVESGRCLAHAAAKERARPLFDVRRWYRTARWQRLRSLKRAESPLCVDCQADGRVVPWDELDHEIPHRGDPRLFWDYENLRGRCKSHHSAKTARGQ